jgi:hypothetical protein
MEQKKAIPTGWKLTYAEVSNNVYNMRLVSECGSCVETKGSHFDEMLAWCIESALNIDDQVRQKKGLPSKSERSK